MKRHARRHLLGMSLFGVGAALLTLFTLCSLLSYVAVEEDAHISFRYAHNLASGDGLGFNATGARTEGYTNFLWVLILAAADLSGWNLPHAAKILGWIAGCACIVLGLVAVWRTARGPVSLACLALVAAAVQPQFVFWCQRGLETGLLMFLHIATLVRLDRERRRPRVWPLSPLLAALAVMTRPDAVLFALIPMIAHGIFALRRRKCRRRSLIALAVFLAPLLSWAAFKLFYYGDILPNSFHFKTDRPLEERLAAAHSQVVAFFTDVPWAALFPLAAPLLWPRPRRYALIWMIWFGALSVIGTTYLTGGDDAWRLNHRFMTPFLPLSAIGLASLAAVALKRSRPRHRWLPWRALHGAVAGALIAVALVPTVERGFWGADYHGDALLARPSTVDRMWRVWWSRPRSVAEHTAAVLHRQVGDQSSIALNHVGRVPFFTGYHTYDTLGLCSAELLPLSRDSLGAVLEFIDEAEVEILALAEWEMTSLGSYSDLTHRYEFLTSTLGWRFMRRLPDSQPPRRSLAVPDGPFAGLEPWDRWLMMARLDDIRERDGEEAWLAAIPKLLDYFPASVPLMRDLSTKLAHARHWDQACSTLERGTEVLELEAAEQPFNAGLMLVLSDWHSHMAVGAPDVAEQRRLYARSLEYAHLAEQREPLSDAVANRIQTVSRRLAFVEAKSAGEELFNAEQWEAACESMRLAVSLAPRDAEAQEMLGVAAQRLGEISEARIAWSRAVSRTTGEESEGVWEKGFAELASMGVSPEEALRVGCASAAQCQQAARWLEERADSSSAWAVRELVTELSR